MAFRPFSLPLSGGVQQDYSAFGLEVQGELQELTNVSFSRKGSISGRPAAQTHNEPAQDAPASGAPVALNTLTASLTKAGVSAVNTAEGERPLAMWQGAQYIYSGSGAKWLRTGNASLVRKYVSDALDTDILLRGAGGTGGHIAPIPVGSSVTGVLGPGIETEGVQFLSSINELQYRGTGTLTNVDAAGRANMAAAGNALFYHTTAGDVRVHLPGALPVTTDVLIAAAVARTDTTPRMNMAAVEETGGGAYFVAWVSATAGRISLRRINSSGAVTATLDVNGLGTVLGVAMGITTGNRLLVGFIDSATTTLTTKVFTTTSTTITDAAIDVALPANASTTGAHSFSFAVGISHLGTGIVAYLNTLANMPIYERSMTAVTNNVRLTLYGAAADGVSWEPLFNPVTVNSNTTLMGAQRVAPTLDYAGGTSNYNVGQSQWFVLNLTHTLNIAGAWPTNNYRGVVLAHGQWRGSGRSKPTQPGRPTATSLAFGLWEGTAFDTLGTSDVRGVRVVLDLAPGQLASGHGGAIVSSANALLFDGVFLQQHPFTESYPDIALVNAAGGGALVGGSYTYQATWEMVNAKGQTVRSGAAEPAVITGIAAGNLVNLTVTTPQLYDNRSSATTVVVKLWATQRNPSAGAPLYLVQASVLGTPAAGTVVIQHINEVDITQPQLYTGGNVLDDAPPPAGDRGVALAIERLWVADQRRVYASKLLNLQYGVSWNTDGQHTLDIPSALGDIQGLAGYDDRLVVVCSNGVAVVRGSGVDDLGDGPGWATDIVLGPGSSSVSPRRVISTPDGVVYEGRGGSLWLVDSGGNRTRFNTAEAADMADAGGDLSYGGATIETSPSGVLLQPRRLHHGDLAPRLAVLDLEVGAWSQWVLPTSAAGHHAVVNGVLWVQDNGYLLSLDSAPGVDDFNGTLTDVVMSFTTGSIRPANGSYAGWGRLRKLQLHGPAPSAVQELDVTVSVTAEDGRSLLSTSNTYTPAAPGATWPIAPYFEYWTEVQRCRYFRLALSITPATVQLDSIEFWVSGGSDAAPNDNRG